MATDTLARVLALSAGSGGGGGSDVVVVTADAVFDGEDMFEYQLNNWSNTPAEIKALYDAGKTVKLSINYGEYYSDYFKDGDIVLVSAVYKQRSYTMITCKFIGDTYFGEVDFIKYLNNSTYSYYKDEDIEYTSGATELSGFQPEGDYVDYETDDSNYAHHIRVLSALPSGYKDPYTLYFITE